MKLIELVNARTALGKLIVQDLPIRTAYELMKLTDEANRHLTFYGQELGKFDLERDLDRLEELNSIEIDVGGSDRIRISLDGDLRLSAGDVKMLTPLVDFIETT